MKGPEPMRDAWGDTPPDRHEAVAAILEEDWWQREAKRQQQEAQRWQRRVEVAERHHEYALAEQAAQRARRHAGLALAAEGRLAAIRLDRLQAERSLDAQLATLKARSQVMAGNGAR